MNDEVLARERAYVAAALQGAEIPTGSPGIAGAVASRYLAVGTPRSFAIVGHGVESLAAHRTWFDPRDLRCTDTVVAAAVGGRVVPLSEALAADIVCIHEPMSLSAVQLRRGTHVNALAALELDADLLGIARVVGEKELAQLAAGLVDGRQLDELTIYVYGR